MEELLRMENKEKPLKCSTKGFFKMRRILKRALKSDDDKEFKKILFYDEVANEQKTRN